MSTGFASTVDVALRDHWPSGLQDLALPDLGVNHGLPDLLVDREEDRIYHPLALFLGQTGKPAGMLNAHFVVANCLDHLRPRLRDHLVLALGGPLALGLTVITVTVNDVPQQPCNSCHAVSPKGTQCSRPSRSTSGFK